MQTRPKLAEGKIYMRKAKKNGRSPYRSGRSCIPVTRESSRDYLGSRSPGAAVGLTLRFTVVWGPAVVDAPANGSLIGAAVGPTFRFTVVPLGAPVAVAPMVGSLIGATVGLTPRFIVVVLLGASVGETPAVLPASRLTSGLAVGLTGPAGRPRCATPTPVRSPSSIPVISSFFIQTNLLFASVAR